MVTRLVMTLLLGSLSACSTEMSQGAHPVQKENEGAHPTPSRPPPSAAVASERKAPPLTPEEEALIAADPNALTPEQRLKRAHALRKRIMQNPDSEAAKSLKAMQEKIERGEAELPPHLVDRKLSAKVAPTQEAPSAPEKAAPSDAAAE